MLIPHDFSYWCQHQLFFVCASISVFHSLPFGFTNHHGFTNHDELQWQIKLSHNPDTNKFEEYTRRVSRFDYRRIKMILALFGDQPTILAVHRFRDNPERTPARFGFNWTKKAKATYIILILTHVEIFYFSAMLLSMYDTLRLVHSRTPNNVSIQRGGGGRGGGSGEEAMAN